MFVRSVTAAIAQSAGSDSSDSSDSVCIRTALGFVIFVAQINQMKPSRLFPLCLLVCILSSCNKDPEEVCILTSIEESDGSTTIIEYDGDDRVTKVSEKGAHSSTTKTYSYNSNGLVSSTLFKQEDGDDFKTTLHYSFGDVLDSATSLVIKDDGSTSLWSRVAYHYHDGKISGYQINSGEDSLIWKTEFSDADAYGNYQQHRTYDLRNNNKPLNWFKYTYDDKPNMRGTIDHHYPLSANSLATTNITSQTEFSVSGAMAWKRTFVYQYDGKSVTSASAAFEHRQSAFNKNYEIEYSHTCREVD